MAEPRIRIETFRAASPMIVGGVTLLLIEHTVAQAAGAGRGLWCWCAKAPHALVIRHAGRVHAVDIGAAPVPLERLREKVPGLDALLAAP